MARRLPTRIQIQKLEDRFCRLNEDDCGAIDFRAEVDNSLTYGENQANIESRYSQYVWEDPDPEIPARAIEEAVIEGLQSEADPYSYTIMKKYKVEALQRDSRRSIRLSKKLDECEATPRRAPSKPGVCRRKTVEVREYRRCLPRPRGKKA